MTRPPFRADQVGSLLHPEWLGAARARCKVGEIDADALRQSEDRAIREAVQRQQDIGLQDITGGEFRRDGWHLDFLGQLDGVHAQGNPGPKFKIAGQSELPPVASVIGRLACRRLIMAGHFRFLASVCSGTPKMATPSPSMLHLRGGCAAISREVDPDLERFRDDVAAACRRAIGHLADAGCRHLQLDDITFAHLGDPKSQASCSGGAHRAAGAAGADPAMRLFEHRPRQCAVAGRAGAQARAGRRGGARGLARLKIRRRPPRIAP